MSNNYKYVGGKFPMQDAGLKASGELIFASDMKLPDMLHVKLLLSPIAHGSIRSIDTSKAEALEGVVKVFTYFNTTHKKFNRYRTVPDQELCIEDECLFAGKARFVGDRIAAVVAVSLSIAKKAVELIDVEFEELPAMAFPEQSLSPDAVPIHPGGNLIEKIEFEAGIPEAGRDEIAEDISSTIITQKMHHASIETHAYLAKYEENNLTIWSPTQGIFGVRTVVADLLGMKYNQVRVIKAPMGGSFGGKQEFFIEPVLAYIAKELKCAVKIHFSRREAILAGIVRANNIMKIRSGLSGEGKLINVEIDNILDSGAYTGSSADQGHAMKTKATRLYNMSYYKHRGRVCYTNTPVSGGMRGWGSPELMTALEIHMDKVARKMKMDPVELRMRNLIDSYTKDLSTGFSLGNSKVKECLKLGAEKFNWQEKSSAQKTSGRYKKGVGVACGAHKNGMFGGFVDVSTMTIRMNEDGSVNLITSIHDVGCGTVRSMQIIAGEVLGINPDEISVTEGDTKYSPYDCGTYGSRSIYVAGAAAYKSAVSLKEKILDAAEIILNKQKQYIELKGDGVGFVNRDKREMSFEELSKIALTQYSIELISTISHKSQSNPGAYSVNFAEVEVDTYTGLVKIIDFVAVHDVGRVINSGMAEGQVQGGVQMAIGYALYEDMNITPQGMVRNDSFKRYNLINMPDMPKVRSYFVEEGGDDGPFGAKSLGEIATVAGAAAVVNAVNDALGTDLMALPLTPDKILAALSERMD
ncbi:MAG: xanthine dehydrogenase family protein molybdopterin-binding subunit [Clostridiaceae bacterium]